MTRLPFTRHTSPDFSRIVFGTWRILNDPDIRTPQDVLELLKTCLDCGITTVDTAEIYGGYLVEKMLGEALALDAGVKAKLQIISKFGIYVPCEFHPDRKTAFYNGDGARAIKSAEKSLRWLGIDALDVLLVHRPDWLGNPADTAAGLTTRLLSSARYRNLLPSRW
jgi:predicted oxidoreductase